jgi:hypothetical protein
MWPSIQMWFPLLTIALTAVICVSVVSFIVGMQRVPGNLAGLTPKTATAEYFFERAEQYFRRPRRSQDCRRA